MDTLTTNTVNLFDDIDVDMDSGRKRGKLSNEEMAYISKNYTTQQPEEIAEVINRQPYPVYNFLQKQIPNWTDHTEYSTQLSGTDYQKKLFDLMAMGKCTKAQAKKMLNFTNAEAKGLSDEQLKAQHFQKFINHFEDFDLCIAGLTDAIKNLKTYVETNVVSWQNEVMDQISEDITEERRELEIQKAMHKSELMTKFNMPLPPSPVTTRAKLTPTISRRMAAIYFGWKDGEVVYVGKTVDLRNRLTAHEKIGKDEPVSYIEYPKHLLYQNECFYIWSLSPSRNAEVVRDSEYIENSSNLTEE